MNKIAERKMNGKVRIQVWDIEGIYYLFAIINIDQPDFNLKDQYPKFDSEQKAISAMNAVTLQSNKMVIFNHSLESEIPDISYRTDLNTQKVKKGKGRKRL